MTVPDICLGIKIRPQALKGKGRLTIMVPDLTLKLDKPRHGPHFRSSPHAASLQAKKCPERKRLHQEGASCLLASFLKVFVSSHQCLTPTRGRPLTQVEIRIGKPRSTDLIDFRQPSVSSFQEQHSAISGLWMIFLLLLKITCGMTRWSAHLLPRNFMSSKPRQKSFNVAS